METIFNQFADHWKLADDKTRFNLFKSFGNPANYDLEPEEYRKFIVRAYWLVHKDMMMILDRGEPYLKTLRK